jgi:DNA (cytosine-5)-methyltransferase 1
MWDVGRFAEQMRYSAIVVENVVEATKWSGWSHWLGWLTDLGYEHRVLSHNSMHHTVPQSRDRIYVVLWRKGLRPDLELELTAWCARCELARTVRQGWKNGRRVGRYRQQWVWACTTCGASCEPATHPAAEIIDWSLACPRIGDRARPLAAATRRRILAGLQRYGWAPITTAGAGHVYETTPGNRARPITDPLPVQGTTAQHALATPPGMLVQPHHGGDDASRVRSTGDPLWTVTASDDRPALVLPLRRNGRPWPVDGPLPTVAAGGNHHALVVRSNGFSGSGQLGRFTSTTDHPLPTVVTTQRPGLLTTKGHQSLLVPYNGTGRALPASAPLGTQPAGERWALVDVDALIDDCGFRMLEPHEIAAAMAFPSGYIPADLTKRDRVKLAGNAVTPPVMAWITGRILQALEAAA